MTVQDRTVAAMNVGRDTAHCERESLLERKWRLRHYIRSTRFALTERDVEYDYLMGHHRYAVGARARENTARGYGRVVTDDRSQT